MFVSMDHSVGLFMRISNCMFSFERAIDLLQKVFLHLRAIVRSGKLSICTGKLSIYAGKLSNTSSISMCLQESDLVCVKIQKPACPWELYISRELHDRLSFMDDDLERDIVSTMTSTDLAREI